MRVVGIYLAAGNSIRLGKDKRFLPINNQPLASLAFVQALQSHLTELIVVVKSNDDLGWIPSIAYEKEYVHKWTFVVAQGGQSNSIKAGLHHAEQADAILIMLADQPFVTSQMINDRLTKWYCNSSLDYVATLCSSVLQPPIILSNKLFPKLFLLTGDQGARLILQSPVYKGSFIEESQLVDVDTLDDYNQLLDAMRQKGEREG
ncbi:nucleotidyltransferase family protein [Priestia koreensis]|uniref:nucleotidyltransferase family protein n=1 Tax=Priestia koreensis TaxID=284581 RepID=UPI001F566215|nr:nucleotidyltransferase family protein [Priestia koreensis]UNL86299.1 NTP transferase domain-containing protein [Priestia koreensis]